MRKHTWAKDLTHYMIDVRKQMATGTLKFGYNSGDPSNINCMSFAMHCVECLTGERYEQAFSGYDTPLSAMRRIKEEGVDDIPGVLAKYFPVKGLAYIHRGDLVLVPAEFGSEGSDFFSLGVGVACPPYFWVVRPEGLARGSLSTVTHVFSVHSMPSRGDA